ncbi:Methionyl-tRNA formyltransferase like protein [Verticillium longisporum]|uniref:Methionyl-tRNA formyltransferase like protein n=1 Tax=Verticillium longisporum TaxID=100787 RepID=A0A8I2Z7F0_VERLO|nr:Methionyl-tRNA formyltransferase like protein [Verticillium longisporum]
MGLFKNKDFATHEFSIAALRALHHEQLRNPSLIESLDVVIRPGKPTGRGLKTVRQVPIKSTAQELGLPIHEINTFTGWTPSFNMNLIVAVSFGLLVPPSLRGPAPLHHTLLLNRPFTGITLQTLHESKFDHGTILSQTSLPGLPVPPGTNLQALHDIVTPPAAEMLVQGLRDGVHVPPLKPVGRTPSQRDLAALRHAPKLTKQDRQVRWRAWAADDFATRETVLGPLWSKLQTRRGRKRVLFEGLEAVAPLAGGDEAVKGRAGAFVAFETGADAGGSGGSVLVEEAVEVSYLEADDGSGSVLISAPGGGVVKVARIKIEGDKSKPAANTLAIHTNVGKAEYWKGSSDIHGEASS